MILLAMPAPELSREQKKVSSAVLDWYREKKHACITMGGYAGTGKTTLLGEIRNELFRENHGLKIAFCCYTGKASRVLRMKLEEAGAMRETDFCGTIHQLIYDPVHALDGTIIDWEAVDSLDYDLIVIDEASMVNAEIWNDLNSYGARIIACGDHGQLPPIEGKLNLMEDPVLKLEEIHRQEAGNPIIGLSMIARTEGRIPPGRYGAGVSKLERGLDETEETVRERFVRFDPDTMVICGLNRTRVRLNAEIRAALGFDGDEPQSGERVICLKNNWNAKQCPVLNGMLGTLKTIERHRKRRKWHWYKASIDMDWEDRPYSGIISKDQFNNPKTIVAPPGVHYTERGDLFDLGYALTVHKAQGSQAKKVILFEEPNYLWRGEMWNRWLYTAVTRAQEELLIVGT